MALVSPDPLTLPVGASAVPTEPIAPEDSVRLAASELAESGVPLVPVTEGTRLVGAVTEKCILDFLAAGGDPDNPVASVLVQPVTINAGATGAEALRALHETGATAAVVVDAHNNVAGIVTPSRLFAPTPNRHLLGKVGGMATPAGVYLTNGIVSGGVGWAALVGTGALLFTLFLVASTAMLVPLNAMPDQEADKFVAMGAYDASSMVLFLLLLRSLPLTGIHAAEHMTVHAMERGEDLKPSIVSRMPRVHPRCGTNLAVAATVFLGTMKVEAIGEPDLRLLVALLATLVVWRPLGTLAQLWVTTKRPNSSQIQQGIRCAEDFLYRLDRSGTVSPNPFQRFLHSGILQIMAGGTLVQLLVWGVYEVLRLPLAWRVF